MYIVFGGDTIYKQLLPYCDVAQVTKIDLHISLTATSRTWMKIHSGM